ncbi:MAG TPA: glycine cleavage system aminomethyltransferase GcvT [Acidobacteriota bacterium]|nr:glycine cleavage system aminomethyltransferase GcvT [Acidobacteriota bacterium]
MTPLNAVQRELGARMADFAGWELPVQFESALKEHLAVRSRAGLFDVSHMGRLEFLGPDALPFAQELSSNDVLRLQDGQAQYSSILTPKGTFLDDIVLYRISAERIFICVNAATREKDLAWIESRRNGNVQVVDRSESTAQLAIQGPVAEAILQELTEADLSALRFYRFVQAELAGAPCLISRTGYTGEDGFEVYTPAEAAEGVWRRIFAAGRAHGLTPAGLAARNTLRLEMRYPLYGNDIDERRTPLEAGLGWIVKFEKPSFVGREALLRQKEEGPSELLVGFELMEPGIARDGFQAYFEGRAIGNVTSGSFSPSLEKSIGLLYFPAGDAAENAEFEIDVRGKRRRARIVPTPFYRKN